MRPEPYTHQEYVAAFRELASRIEASLADAPPTALPIRMYVAGGTALHFHTGERVSVDVDAVFSRRIALPERLDVAYRDHDGAARLLYFDRQYNDTRGLTHEDAYDDSLPLTLDGIDSRVLDVRIPTPLDLAASKLGRFSEQDRSDIAALARRGLVSASSIEARALEALRGYVGDTSRLQGNIASAAKIVAASSPARQPPRLRLDTARRKRRLERAVGIEPTSAARPRSAHQRNGDRGGPACDRRVSLRRSPAAARAGPRQRTP